MGSRRCRSCAPRQHVHVSVRAQHPVPDHGVCVGGTVATVVGVVDVLEVSDGAVTSEGLFDIAEVLDLLPGVVLVESVAPTLGVDGVRPARIEGVGNGDAPGPVATGQRGLVHEGLSQGRVRIIVCREHDVDAAEVAHAVGAVHRHNGPGRPRCRVHVTRGVVGSVVVVGGPVRVNITVTNDPSPTSGFAHVARTGYV